MKIAIDVREFKKGKYTGLRSMLDAFLSNVGETEDEFVLYCDRDTDIDALPLYMEKYLISSGSTFLWDQVFLPRGLKKKGADVFFSPYIKTPFRRVCPYVNTVADTIPLETPKNKGLRAVLEKMHFLFFAHICSRRSVRVMTISEASKKKIEKTLGLSGKKIDVIYPSVVSRGEGSVRGMLEEPYILYLGNFKAHKNLDRLIEAYALFPADVKSGFQLCLAGGEPDGIERLKSLVEEKGLSDRVLLRKGGMGAEEKAALIKNASLFVFPSLSEGFGIPPVEAMAAGIPVAVSGISPMTEVLGEAALFFDPEDPKDIAEKVLTLLEDKSLRGKM
ncbi:MAG: glycosyltransferase family 1 protein [Candidatus Tantalella remota]|nr:glycosyltransferase family 1 protein [Candidatus Tantalella remota]